MAALILIVTAIAAEMVSKRHAGFGMMTMAKAAQAMNDAKQFENPEWMTWRNSHTTSRPG